MYRLIKVFFFCCIAFPLKVCGQNYFNTPYSSYAAGDQIMSGFSYNRSLGGSGIALRPKNQINYLNPASYTAQDTLSFLFEVGATERIVKLFSDTDEGKSNNMNIEYLALGFPITRWCKFSVGIAPYSRMQYFFQELPINSETETMLLSYNGSGGFNEFYFGPSFTVGNFLSIGANAGYLFGSLYKNLVLDYADNSTGGTSTILNENYVASDFYYKIGVQAFKTFNEKHELIFGATVDPKTKIKLKQNKIQFRDFHNIHGAAYLIDTLSNISDSLGYFNLPAKIGLGFTYIYDNKLLLTLEYEKQNFSKGSFFGNSNNLADYSSVRFGAEFTPVPITERKRAKYIQRVHYRIGSHYTSTPLILSGTRIKDYGFSVGFGIPLRNPQKIYTYSTFNITYEYGIRGTLDNGLIKEKYQIITVGLTLHDFWFFKPKYD
jgi:hypothetical protein